ncbi:microtubule-actin cross-linking factor 1, isoforms 6/7-like [Larus michahellis]|uniref:microtubule-actin cross-linking factor 1, isoforms 6/7-like n=1 Tax=Larus michahellis TaxID=119627 RepID=UPI003D9B1A57
MIARSEGVDKDISAKAVQDKLDQMVLIWEDVWSLTEEREAKLLDVMKLAAKLWCSHVALAATIKDTQELIGELEGPGVDPSVVTQEQEDAEAAKEETDGLQEELATVLSLGSELRAACGEPDKPVVNKSIDELNSAWDALSKTRKERADKLVEALQAAVQYQDGLQLTSLDEVIEAGSCFLSAALKFCGARHWSNLVNRSVSHGAPFVAIRHGLRSVHKRNRFILGSSLLKYPLQQS